MTGHDRPEYQRSAVVPLRWGSPRLLCLDRGLFRVLGEDLRSEAFRAARLWRYEFDASTDLVVSPFRPDSEFIGVNNKVRDRLVSTSPAGWISPASSPAATWRLCCASPSRRDGPCGYPTVRWDTATTAPSERPSYAGLNGAGS